MTFSSSLSLKTNTLRLIKTKPLKTDNAQFKLDCDETAQYKRMGGGGGGSDTTSRMYYYYQFVTANVIYFIVVAFFNFVLFYGFKCQALKSFCNCTYCSGLSGLPDFSRLWSGLSGFPD